MYTRADINDFIAQKKIALAGISRNKKKFGNIAFDELKKKGYELFLIHPQAKEINHTPCYSALADIPEKVGGVLVCVPPGETMQVVREAAQAGIPRVWLQQGAASDEAIDYCHSHHIKVVHDECILMFAEPTGFAHRLHRGINRWLGKLPQ